MRRKTVMIGLLGSVLDKGPAGTARWEKWRPTVALCQHADLLIDRFELLHQSRFASLARIVEGDLRSVSPETEVRATALELKDPWDFEEVFAALHDFARAYPFDPEREDYLVHITTGTHVAQICLFLLTESRHLPARLVQTAPPPGRSRGSPGTYRIIDLDLSRYDRIASRFRVERDEALVSLKSGIATRNAAFNVLIERVERVAMRSTAPILLQGPTGAGKTVLARRIYEVKKARRLVEGPLVEVNCATLRGDAAMSTLFGHVRGAFTGALRDRPGLLLAAHKGLLLLDEIGELGPDEQAMLLRALEDRRFLPLGADRDVGSDFQLIAGTNRDLGQAVARGTFREDLLARIDLWTFRLPGLRERPEDVEPNLAYELDEYARRTGQRVGFNAEARARFLAFAADNAAPWPANFREFNAAVTRMATLAPGGRITTAVVDDEIARLRSAWRRCADASPAGAPADLLPPRLAADLDRFDAVQLAEVVRVCRSCRSLSEAGRELFDASRRRKASPNDADRLRKYLARFNLGWADLRASIPPTPTRS
ncbi:MAG: sigma 54-interacting transcriptional regulator [Deltaproteobacteria bacterium]|nr:sigma 54-interacting transcriptional regulator [Deltaproteobacteria bacterium]